MVQLEAMHAQLQALRVQSQLQSQLQARRYPPPPSRAHRRRHRTLTLPSNSAPPLDEVM